MKTLLSAAALTSVVLSSLLETVGAEQQKSLSTYLHEINIGGKVEKCEATNVKGHRHVCDDGTISYYQSDEEGSVGGGICGAVAAATWLDMVCQTSHLPTTLAFSGGIDSETGADAVQVHRDLIFPFVAGSVCENYDIDSLPQDPSRLFASGKGSLKEKMEKLPGQRTPHRWNPVLVPLRYGSTGHWTTVVGINIDDGQCAVRHNSWAEQFQTPCREFRTLYEQADEDVIWLDGYCSISLFC